METDEEPLLALYAWYGSLESDLAFAKGADQFHPLDTDTI